MKTEAYDKVRTARSNSRPTSMDYIHHVFDVFFDVVHNPLLFYICMAI